LQLYDHEKEQSTIVPSIFETSQVTTETANYSAVTPHSLLKHTL